MIHENDVRSKLAALLSDDVSLVDFSRWIADHSWNMHKDSAPNAIDLVSDIHILLAEYNDHAISDEAFFQQMEQLRAAHRTDVWNSAAVPVIVRLDFASQPEPLWVKTSVARRARRFEPVLAEL